MEITKNQSFALRSSLTSKSVLLFGVFQFLVSLNKQQLRSGPRIMGHPEPEEYKGGNGRGQGGDGKVGHEVGQEEGGAGVDALAALLVVPGPRYRD